MSEYGSGLTFGQACNFDKDRIKHALRGELMCDEDENGFVYAPASREECEKFILSKYDECVYQALQSMDSGRALSRLMEEHGVVMGKTYTVMEYGALVEEEHQKFNDYVYEPDDEELDDPPECENGESVGSSLPNQNTTD